MTSFLLQMNTSFSQCLLADLVRVESIVSWQLPKFAWAFEAFGSCGVVIDRIRRPCKMLKSGMQHAFGETFFKDWVCDRCGIRESVWDDIYLPSNVSSNLHHMQANLERHFLCIPHPF